MQNFRSPCSSLLYIHSRPTTVEKETQKCYDLKNFDKKNFCEDLQDSLNMHFVNIFSNIEMDLNSSFTKFLSVVRNVITKHAPLRLLVGHKSESKLSRG